MDNDVETDQREEHRQTPNKAAPYDELKKVGVLHWRLDADKGLDCPKLKDIREARGYSYHDIITVHKDSLPNYEMKIKSFFEEHLHTDEEIRFIVDGSGYFDVRSVGDEWIRIACKKGDMIILPEGMYHRFTLDASNYIKAIRLFVGEPVWTPYNRPQEELPSRKKYVESFIAPATAEEVAAVDVEVPAVPVQAEAEDVSEPAEKKQKLQ